MSTAPLPFDEAARLASVRALRVLDTPPEERFDRFTRLVGTVLDVPMAFVSIVDEDRQFNKACFGTELREVAGEHSFCAAAVRSDRLLVIEDATEDPRFADSPFVAGPPFVRAYAGRPLHGPNGHLVGTLCALDTRARTFDQRERSALEDLAALVEDELKQVEVEELAARFDAIMDGALDGLVTFGVTGAVELANRAAGDLLGMPPEALVGRHVADLLDVPWADLQRELASTLSSGTAGGLRREVLVRRDDGSRVPVELTVREAPMPSGRTFVAVGRDISDRLTAERALAEALDRLESLLASVGEGIVGVDPEGHVQFVNRAAEEVLRLAPGAAVGAPLDAVMPRWDAAGTPIDWAASQLRMTLTDGRTRRVRRTVARADGERFPADLVITPVLTDGATTGAVVLLEDVTQREAVERMKDEFVSVVSHELRTPLTSIRGSLGLLAGGVFGELPAEPARMVQVALSNTERLVRLVNDILDLERMEAGKLELEVGDVPAEALAEDTVQALGHVAQEAGVGLRAEAEAGILVRCDRDRVVQALTNLVGNAVKFSPEGEDVVVRARRDGGVVRFEVRDRGRGIPREHLARVFERFSQVDGSDAREKGGSGLGLAIARSIVERHGGEIGVESRVGEGSTFAFTLPAAGEEPA